MFGDWLIGQVQKVGGYQITRPNPAGGILDRLPCVLRKCIWVISDYPLLKCITARKSEILCSITRKMTCIIRKLIQKPALKTLES